jgi:VIT1/CCC1 family predicted Fe2+/Mn2+ transporter
MPPNPHIERHFTARQLVRDIVIGISDGLTVPFALAAGLSGAILVNKIIITAGLAEIAAGAIAMGLGGYLAAKGDAEHYTSEKRREWREITEIPEAEKKEVREIFSAYGLSDADIEPLVYSLEKRPKDWVNFMMKFELSLDEPKPKQAVISAITIAISYIAGGLIPLFPYMVINNANISLLTSIFLTLLALFIFGFIKGIYIGNKPILSAIQTLFVGAIAATVAFFIARLVSGI